MPLPQLHNVGESQRPRGQSRACEQGDSLPVHLHAAHSSRRHGSDSMRSTTRRRLLLLILMPVEHRARRRRHRIWQLLRHTARYGQMDTIVPDAHRTSRNLHYSGAVHAGILAPLTP